MKVGDNLDIADGVISVATATDSDIGLAKLLTLDLLTFFKMKGEIGKL